MKTTEETRDLSKVTVIDELVRLTKIIDDCAACLTTIARCEERGRKVPPADEVARLTELHRKTFREREWLESAIARHAASPTA